MTATSILVVDSDSRHRDYLVNILISNGFETIACDDREQAFDRLATTRLDMVIMDDGVNNLTPETLLEEIQRLDLDTFTAVMSSSPDTARGMKWMLAGAFAYLAKPVSPDALLPIIRKGQENKEAYHQVVNMANALKETNQALEKEKAALKEKSDQLLFLYSFASALSASLDAEEIARTVAKAVAALFGPDLVLILGAFDPQQGLRLYTDRRLRGDLVKGLGHELMLEAGLTGHGGQERFRIVDVSQTEKPLEHAPMNRHVLPLVAAGKKCGALGLFFEDPSQIDGDRIVLLESLALQAAQALLNAYQHEQALNKAAHDALTGLANRRTFDEVLKREFERSVRYGAKTALIMLDLDRFKSVNDRFGHAAGDEVLKAVAAALRKSVRTTDMAARIGGEEFAVILPSTGQDKALKLARRIQANLKLSPVHLGDIWLKQTVSQGVADTAVNGISSVGDLIKLADRAMYLAKEQGRNTIRSASDLTTIEPGRGNRYACR